MNEVIIVSKFKEILNSLDLEDLEKIQLDVHSGAKHMRHLVDLKIKEMKSSRDSQCAICGRDLNENSSNFTLIFGPHDFKKKGSFCEIDCLIYFINQLKGRDKQIKEMTSGGG